MLDDFDKWKIYLEIAVVLAAVSAIVRPFISIFQKIKEVVLTIIGSIMVGWLVDDLAVGQFLKNAAVGLGGLFAVRLFDIAETILVKIQEDPVEFLERVRNEQNRRH